MWQAQLEATLLVGLTRVPATCLTTLPLSLFLSPLAGHHCRRCRATRSEGSAQPLPESRQVCTASGTLAGLLSGTAAAHHRWGTAAAQSHRCDERAAKVPQNTTAARLLASSALRCEEGFLLPGRQREAQ